MITNISNRLTKIILKFVILFLSVRALFCCNAGAESIYQSQLDVNSFDIDDANATIKILQDSIDGIVDQLYELDSKELNDGGDVSEKYKEVRNEIISVIQDINYTTESVGNMLKKISLYKKQINENTQSLKDIRGGIDTSKQYIQEFSNFLYKLSNQISNNGQIDDIRLITLTDNISTSLANEQLVKSMLSQFNDMMDELNIDEQKQVKLIVTLNKLKLNASENVESYRAILDALNQKKNYLIEFMTLYKDNKLAEQEFSIVFDSIKDVYNAIQSMITNIVSKTYQDTKIDMTGSLQKANELYEETLAGSGNLQPLAWPIYPIQEISTYFGDKEFEKANGIPCQGIQIKAEQGTPVYSASEGVVYHVTNNPGIGINWIMIVHPKGYITVYMYLNDILIEKGDIVRRGQLLGHSGGEPGTNGAGFISQGPNLTFIVFKDGVAIDPLQFLDLSVIENKNIIPTEYNIKYLNDKYARTIDISEVKFATGDTLNERAENFLSEYGVGAYKQLAFWEDAVASTNIDRDVVICIAFAESTLGRYLTTSNNIGNVGNDDRGNRVSFASALAGARSIPDTLNNINLGGYHTIRQLSRYGNVDGKIYASSPINWQRNVTKCLSQIKGYYVPEDYPFRVGLNPRLTGEDDGIGETMTYVKKVD